jgi:hypothetical protein
MEPSNSCHSIHCNNRKQSNTTPKMPALVSNRPDLRRTNDKCRAGGGEAAIRGDGRRPQLRPLGNHRRPAHIRYVRQAALHCA